MFDGCTDETVCWNTVGSFHCDFNECDQLSAPCNDRGECFNDLGNYTCFCDEGYDPDTRCYDLLITEDDDENSSVLYAVLYIELGMIAVMTSLLVYYGFKEFEYQRSKRKMQGGVPEEVNDGFDAIEEQTVEAGVNGDDREASGPLPIYAQSSKITQRLSNA